MHCFRARHYAAVATVASINCVAALGNTTDIFTSVGSLRGIVEQACSALRQILPGGSTTATLPTWQATLSQYTADWAGLLADRTALENTSLLLALGTFLVLAMSWVPRFGFGRASPFTRSPPQGSTHVSDADFSYITTEDLRRHNEARDHTAPARPTEESVDYGPPRDTDVLILRNQKQDFYVHFPAYSIAKGELTVGQVRDHAAKKMNAADVRRVKLLYRGKNLQDDSRTCKSEGLRDGAELLLLVADAVPSGSVSEDDDEDEEFPVADSEPKRRRNRGKKTKRRNKREQQQEQSTSDPNVPPEPSNLSVPPSRPSTRAPSPKPVPSPSTPLDKLNALRQTLGTFLPQVRAFQDAPPADPGKRDFEYKRLSETILAQVLLKLDAVETEGDADARTRRKELVKETQSVLHDLDAVVKK